MSDELKQLKIEGRIIDKGFEKPVIEDASKAEEPQTITRAEAIELIKEEASRQMKEVMEKLEALKEDTAGKIEYAHPVTQASVYPNKEEVTVTSKTINDKGNYTNIHRLGALIAKTADLIVGEYSDLQPVIAEETNIILQKCVAHLNEFVARL